MILAQAVGGVKPAAGRSPASATATLPRPLSGGRCRERLLCRPPVAGHATCSAARRDGEVALDLGQALVAGFVQPDGFLFELSRVLPSCLAYGLSPVSRL